MSHRIITILFVLIQVSFSLLEDPVVKVVNGQILGRKAETASNTTYYAFEGIPFAKPPTGNLRFKPPQPPENWEGILNVTASDIMCYQISGTSKSQTEDCLRLNVFTPELPGSENLELLPVMVYIYGGSFTSGSTLYYPPDLFVDNGVVYVAINYRIGVFGFISTEDEIIPGNSGLKDQLLSLEWVHNNIKFFNGDPERVTLFGQSAGAGSSSYLLLHPKTQELISAVILQSGTFLSPRLFRRSARSVAFGTGSVLDPKFKTNYNSSELLEILIKTEADILNEAATEYFKSISSNWDELFQDGCKFAPVIETENSESIFTTKQYGLLKNHKILAVPTMIGFTSLEKIGSFQSGSHLKNVASLFDDNLNLVAPADMEISSEEEAAKMGSLIRDTYTNGSTFAENLGGALRYSSDNFMTRSTIKYAEIYSSPAPTYFYQFSFDGDLDHSEVQYDGANGVGHSAEIKYLFCRGSACTQTSEADLLTRQRVTKLWTNFAKYQNPTPEPSDSVLQNVTWPPVDVKNGNFLYLDIGDDLTVKNHPKEDSYGRWVELYDSLGYDDFDTY